MISKEHELSLMMKNPDSVNWWKASSKERALPLLMKYPERAYWIRLSTKKWALPLLMKYPKNVWWSRLPNEQWVLPLMMAYPAKVWWSYLSRQKWAFELLVNNPEKIKTDRFVSIFSPTNFALNQRESLSYAYYQGEWTLPLYIKNIDNLNWYGITMSMLYSPGCHWLVNVAVRRPELVLWDLVYTAIYCKGNERSYLLPLLKAHPSRQVLILVSNYDWAFDLVIANIHLLFVSDFANSPSIVHHLMNDMRFMSHWESIVTVAPYAQYNHQIIKAHKEILHRELIEYVYHPKRVMTWFAANPEKNIEDYLQ